LGHGGFLEMDLGTNDSLALGQVLMRSLVPGS
jgi:hypothetical protein